MYTFIYRFDIYIYIYLGPGKATNIDPDHCTSSYVPPKKVRPYQESTPLLDLWSKQESINNCWKMVFVKLFDINHDEDFNSLFGFWGALSLQPIAAHVSTGAEFLHEVPSSGQLTLMQGTHSFNKKGVCICWWGWILKKIKSGINRFYEDKVSHEPPAISVRFHYGCIRTNETTVKHSPM